MQRLRRTSTQRLLAGLLAAGPAVLVLVGWHVASSRPGLLEAISDGFVAYLPLDVFEAGTQTFGPLAKGLLYFGVTSGVLGAGMVIGVAALRATATRRPIGATSAIALGSFFATELLVLPIFRAGFFGSDLDYDRIALHVPVVLASLVYGLVLVGLRETLLGGAAPGPAGASQASSPEGRLASAGQSMPEGSIAAAAVGPAMVREARDGRAEQGGGLTRRLFLGRTLVAVGVASLAGSLVGVLNQVLSAARHGPSVARADFAPGGFGPTPALTPVADFYTVNKNVLPTVVDGGTWALEIDGLVNRPQKLALDELRTMPAQVAYRTLECISTNIVRGDHLISNQKWRGVRVSDLLDRAGPRAEARYIHWVADDGYTESLPIDVALDVDTWIAYEMGDAPLTVEHGFPARVLIAGRFGMKQPKWLRRMTLSDRDEAGYWEVRGWNQEAVVRTMSRVDFPLEGNSVPVGAPFEVYGIAFSGARGVLRMEVSPDSGATWQATELEDTALAPLGPLTWVRWRAQISLSKAGPATILARATDGTGATQEGTETSPLPSGATGWHRINVVARV